MNVAVVMQGFAAVAWVIVILGIVLIFTRVSRGRNPRPGIVTALAGLLLALVLTTISAGLVFIPPEQRGVVISAVAPNGYRDQALQPGLRWIVPFLESVEQYSISKITYTMSIAPSEGAVIGDDSITARTRDGQEILVDASVIFSVDPAKVIQVHIDWQGRYTNDLIRPVARGVIRDAVSQYGVEEVVSGKRDEMTLEITNAMRDRLADNGLLLSDFVLRNITFSNEYAASVEQKQIAEQLALQAELVVEQRRQEAEQARQTAQGVADAAVIEAQGRADSRLIEADAEAKALELIAAAIQENPEILQYQYINQLSPNIRVMLVPSNAPYLLPLPSLDETGETVVVQPSTQPAPQPSPQPSTESTEETTGESSTTP